MNNFKGRKRRAKYVKPDDIRVDRVDMNTGEYIDTVMAPPVKFGFKYSKRYIFTGKYLELQHSDQLTRMQMKLFNWCVSIATPDRGYFFANKVTMAAFVEKTGYSYNSVRSQFYDMVKTGIVQRVIVGMYMINPEYAWHGNTVYMTNALSEMNKKQRVDEGDNDENEG